jgi:hypothetical protein
LVYEKSIFLAISFLRVTLKVRASFLEKPKMDALWVCSDPAKQFLDKLRRKRAIEFMRNESYMRQLRYNHEMAERDQRAFGKIWEEYGTDVNQLIAEAWGENWDFEDEEKARCARVEALKKLEPINQNNDNLVTTRQRGARQRLHEFQGIHEKSECVLEKEERRGSESPQKAPRKEKDSGRSRAFYRLAGGC